MDCWNLAAFELEKPNSDYYNEAYRSVRRWLQDEGGKGDENELNYQSLSKQKERAFRNLLRSFDILLRPYGLEVFHPYDPEKFRDYFPFKTFKDRLRSYDVSAEERDSLKEKARSRYEKLKKKARKKDRVFVISKGEKWDIDRDSLEKTLENSRREIDNPNFENLILHIYDAMENTFKLWDAIPSLEGYLAGGLRDDCSNPDWYSAVEQVDKLKTDVYSQMSEARYKNFIDGFEGKPLVLMGFSSLGYYDPKKVASHILDFVTHSPAYKDEKVITLVAIDKHEATMFVGDLEGISTVFHRTDWNEELTKRGVDKRIQMAGIITEDDNHRRLHTEEVRYENFQKGWTDGKDKFERNYAPEDAWMLVIPDSRNCRYQYHVDPENRQSLPYRVKIAKDTGGKILVIRGEEKEAEEIQQALDLGVQVNMVNDSHIGPSIGGIGWHMSLATTDMVRFQMEDAGMLSSRQSDTLKEATVNQTEKLMNSLDEQLSQGRYTGEGDETMKFFADPRVKIVDKNLPAVISQESRFPVPLKYSPIQTASNRAIKG